MDKEEYPLLRSLSPDNGLTATALKSVLTTTKFLQHNTFSFHMEGGRPQH